MKMKLIYALLLVSLHASGQFTGTGNEPQQKNTGSGNTQVTFILGLSSPAGEFKTNDLTKDFSQAIGVKPGWMLGMQGFTDFKLNLGTPSLKAGLNFNTSITIHQVNWEKWISNTDDFKKSPFMIVDFRLGPSLSYRFNDQVALDIFFNLGPAMALGGTGEWTNGSTITTFSSETVAFGLKTGLGAAVRLSGFLIGIQYTPAKFKFKYDLQMEAPSTSIPVVTKEYQLPMNTLQFYIGFGKKKEL